jgi:exopolyphosphatase/guanosine-5'-triphosphate,3'-diphosphate pyrophosphatase
MEVGRGDLVIPGLEIILSLMQKTQSDSLKVSDSGILEGLLLSQQNTDNP